MPNRPAAATLRREVGPVAWCVLECLLEQSVDGGRTAAASVRALAAELGVAKNTAHRGITTLTRAGLVEAVQPRNADGRFQAGRYRLRLVDIAAPASNHSRRRRHATTSVAPAQLTLLPSA
jgi:DNA-binding IclR family transcriptional regulator